jgi:hypothetical protein
MKRLLESVENVVDHFIPYALVVLALIIIGELFYAEELAPFEFWIGVADAFVIIVFLVDLGFKFSRTRQVGPFVRRYWLDIVAVFPFYLAFRLFEEAVFIAGLAERLRQVQALVHETLGVEHFAGALIADVEKTGRLSRTEGFTRFVQPLFRGGRFAKGVKLLPEGERLAHFFSHKGKPLLKKKRH